MGKFILQYKLSSPGNTTGWQRGDVGDDVPRMLDEFDVSQIIREYGGAVKGMELQMRIIKNQYELCTCVEVTARVLLNFWEANQ